MGCEDISLLLSSDIYGGTSCIDLTGGHCAVWLSEGPVIIKKKDSIKAFRHTYWYVRRPNYSVRPKNCTVLFLQ